MPSLAERFWSKVDKNGPMHPTLRTNCWDWVGATTSEGRYGCIYVVDRNRRAHVVSFFLQHGRWPTPCCLHRCDRGRCVRPEHLDEGSQGTNVREAVQRKRHVSGLPPGKGEDALRARLTWELVREMRRLRHAGHTIKKLSTHFRVSETQVANIINNRQWVE